MSQTLADIKALLNAHGLRPKHRHGQNFLHDDRKMQAILQAADIRPGDLVLEVGPGTGALTQRLLMAGARVLAVEIDRDLEPILHDQLSPFADRFRLIIADVLEGKHQINPLVLKALSNAPDVAPEPFKLVANLPYHVASPLLVNLAVDCLAMTVGIVMVQREVADRLTAEPGGKEYGQLGVMVQAMCRVERLTTLPPGCFWPPPKVESAVVRLLRRSAPLTDQPHQLSQLLHRLFSRRRKQLGAILGRDHPLPPGVQATQRPETLSVEQLVQLSQLVQPS